MSNLKDPACLFYISNWLLSTAGMKASVRGWYLNLILHNYDKGSLPNDINELALLAGVRFDEFDEFTIMYENVISKKFKLNQASGRLENPKAAEIMKSREIFKEKRVKSGNIGVITKMAKKFVGFSRFAVKLKIDLASFDDQQLEFYKDYDNLKGLIDSYLNPPSTNDEIDISFVDAEYLETFKKWLRHKRGLGERYKTPESLQQAYKKLLKNAGNNSDVAKDIIDSAIGNNYSGFFPLDHKAAVASVPQPTSKAQSLFEQNERLKRSFTNEE